MQPQIMGGLAGIFALFYLACVVGVTIFLLVLLWRFVAAHEKMAASLDIIARKLKDQDKP